MANTRKETAIETNLSAVTVFQIAGVRRRPPGFLREVRKSSRSRHGDAIAESIAQKWFDDYTSAQAPTEGAVQLQDVVP